MKVLQHLFHLATYSGIFMMLQVKLIYLMVGVLLEMEACYAKKCDNLLVETDIFCHFRGLILCNAKSLQFHLIKNKNTGAQFNKSPIHLCRPFFNLWSCCFRMRYTTILLIATAPLSFLMVAG